LLGRLALVAWVIVGVAAVFIVGSAAVHVLSGGDLARPWLFWLVAAVVVVVGVTVPPLLRWVRGPG
jgi:hypothetical protein